MRRGLTRTRQAELVGVCRQTFVRWDHGEPMHESTLRLVEGYLASAEAPLSRQLVQPGEPLERVLEAVGVLCRARREQRAARQQVILRAFRAMRGD